MFIAIVQVPVEERIKADAIESGKASAPTFFGVKGLIRKYYLNGEAGGVYLWESREDAEAWYNDQWWVRMEKAFGVRPTLTYYDNYVIVDNAASELRVEGEPTPMTQAAAE